MSATSAAPAAQPAFDGDSVVKVTDLVAGYLPGVALPDQPAFLARVGDLARRVLALEHSLRRGMARNQARQQQENSKLLI